MGIFAQSFRLYGFSRICFGFMLGEALFKASVDSCGTALLNDVSVSSDWNRLILALIAALLLVLMWRSGVDEACFKLDFYTGVVVSTVINLGVVALFGKVSLCHLYLEMMPAPGKGVDLFFGCACAMAAAVQFFARHERQDRITA